MMFWNRSRRLFLLNYFFYHSSPTITLKKLNETQPKLAPVILNDIQQQQLKKNNLYRRLSNVCKYM